MVKNHFIKSKTEILSLNYFQLKKGNFCFRRTKKKVLHKMGQMKYVKLIYLYTQYFWCILLIQISSYVHMKFFLFKGGVLQRITSMDGKVRILNSLFLDYKKHYLLNFK